MSPIVTPKEDREQRAAAEAHRKGRAGMPSGQIVSYEFEDILAQRTYRAMYGGNTKGNKYFLLGFVFPSQTVFTQGLGGSTTVVDKDFDVEFKSSQVIEGLAIAQLTCVPIGDTTVTPYIYIRKYSRAGVETDLVSVTGTGAATTQQECYGLDVPQTKFKRGDFLRITVRIDTNTSGAGAGGKFWHDPTGITDPGAGEDSEFKCWVPFKPVL